MLSTNTILHKSENQVSCELDGETVLLDLDSGRYFAMDTVAADIWARLEQPQSIAQLVTELSDAYDCKGADVEADVQAYIKQLVDRNMLLA